MSLTRSSAFLAAIAGGLAAFAAPSAAHVTVNPSSATKGGYAKLTFRAPTERPDSATVKLEVTFPTDNPITSVSVRPHTGWTYTVDKTKLAAPIVREGREPITEVVSKVSWSGGTIKPGEFDEFEVSAGPLPKDADQIVFKAVQTYASGEVVSWIEEVSPGGSEPAHPAPVLKLTAGEAVQAVPVEAATSADLETGGTGGSGEAASKSDLDGVKGLATFAFVVGGLGLLAGLAALVRRRTTTPGPAALP